GFVIGGALPAALAADWLATAWDQNAGLYAGGPSASVVEQVTREWLVELLGLRAESSIGFVTGTQMAHVTGLAAARWHVLDAVGWDVGAQGLNGAPPVLVIAGEKRHATVDRALRLLGLGLPTVVAADSQGRLVPDALREALGDGPTIVCAQAGEVNTGAFDPLPDIADLAEEAGAWLHVDGAFGIWAALRSLGRSGLQELVERSCDGASRFAEAITELEGVELLNEVVLNQVLFRFESDERTDEVLRLVQEDGRVWMSGTTWDGSKAIRLSVSNWQTGDAEIDLAVEAFAQVAGQVPAR